MTEKDPMNSLAYALLRCVNLPVNDNHMGVIKKILKDHNVSIEKLNSIYAVPPALQGEVSAFMNKFGVAWVRFANEAPFYTVVSPDAVYSPSERPARQPVAGSADLDKLDVVSDNVAEILGLMRSDDKPDDANDVYNEALHRSTDESGQSAGFEPGKSFHVDKEIPRFRDVAVQCEITAAMAYDAGIFFSWSLSTRIE